LAPSVPVPGRTVAVLTWDDVMHTSGEPYTTLAANPDNSCVAALGAPSVDRWEGQLGGLIPNEYFLDGTGSSRWNVAGLVREWLRDSQAERRGVLLKGFDGSLDAEDDSTDCFSRIGNRAWSSSTRCCPNPRVLGSARGRRGKRSALAARGASLTAMVRAELDRPTGDGSPGPRCSR